MIEHIELPGTNLRLYSSGKNRKGHKTVKIGYEGKRAFTIVTAGNLTNTGQYLRGLHTPDEINKALKKSELKKIGSEIAGHIAEYGTAGQKAGLRLE